MGLFRIFIFCNDQSGTNMYKNNHLIIKDDANCLYQCRAANKCYYSPSCTLDIISIAYFFDNEHTIYKQYEFVIYIIGFRVVYCYFLLSEKKYLSCKLIFLKMLIP